jgi:pimeloyl-ACP methyl ester carboxylesterase
MANKRSLGGFGRASRLGAWLDARLSGGQIAQYRRDHTRLPNISWLQTRAGLIRVFDSGGDLPCVLMTPDGPNVIEHYQGLIELLSPQLRVVCFDMPGFGLSASSAAYDHSLEQGAAAIIELLDQLAISKATFAFSCANGFYAMRVAQLAPHRVSSLLLSQTPSLEAMHRWTERVVPRILKVPVLGQLLSRLFRQKMAVSWYRIALPKNRDGAAFRETARSVLRCGGCFSLAGVVQGLIREPVNATQGVTAPCNGIWGRQDWSHRLTDVQALQHDAPHAGLLTFDECGHFPDLEEPWRFAQLLLEQIARHDKTQAQA